MQHNLFSDILNTVNKIKGTMNSSKRGDGSFESVEERTAFNFMIHEATVILNLHLAKITEIYKCIPLVS